MLEMIPSSTMMNVSVLFDETPTSLRISAAIRSERRRPQGNEHEVARVGSDARDDPEQHDDECQRALRRDADELAYQRGYQPGRLRQADADHHDEDDRHRREVPEVVDERREEVADAVAGEQALDLRRLGDEAVVLRRLRFGRADVTRL